MTPRIIEAVKLSPEPETAMWFDIGAGIKIQPYRVDFDEILKLPFPRIGIVGEDNSGCKFSIWLTSAPNGVIVAGYLMPDGAPIYFDTFAYVETDEGIKYYNKQVEIPESKIKTLFSLVVCCLLKITFLEKAHKLAAQPGTINSKRLKKGKKPLFDWVTVEIGKKEEKTEHKGGTHASPRLHDRRGHWRMIKATGKRIWVKSCKVGDASLGVVYHDYKVIPD